MYFAFWDNNIFFVECNSTFLKHLFCLIQFMECEILFLDADQENNTSFFHQILNSNVTFEVTELRKDPNYIRQVNTLDNLIIQTSHQRSAPYTNLYTLTKCCYWLDSKLYSQPEFRNLSTPIKETIVCIQIQTGSLVLILVYIFNCLMSIHRSIDLQGVSKTYFYGFLGKT